MVSSQSFSEPAPLGCDLLKCSSSASCPTPNVGQDGKRGMELDISHLSGW